MQETVWFFAKDEQQQGPVRESELKRMLLSGELAKDALVWNEHMPDWQPAASIDQLVVRRSTPPPLPQQPLEMRHEHLAPADLLKPHPWHRYWARFIDNSFALVPAGSAFLLVGVFIQFVVGGDDIPRNMRLPTFVIQETTAFAIYAFLEPLILGVTGTTLGKFIFNIKLRNTFTGKKIDFIQAFKRTFFVWLRGGFSLMLIPVPILNLLGCCAMEIYQYNQLVKNGITSWDRDESLSYEHHPIEAGRWVAFGFAMFFSTIFLVLMTMGQLSLMEYLKKEVF